MRRIEGKRERNACWQEEDGEVESLLCLLMAEDLLTLLLGEGVGMNFRELESRIMGKKACLELSKGLGAERRTEG